MLILGSSFLVGEVEVFQDESQPDLLYTAPASLRVVRTRTGSPSFTLAYYGDGANLMLETEWKVDAEEREQIMKHASSAYRSEHGAGREPSWRLVPVPILEGKAKLQLIEYEKAPALLGESVVSGYGAMRAAMSFQLAASMAVRVERALRVDDADVVASYELNAAASGDAAARWEVNLESGATGTITFSQATREPRQLQFTPSCSLSEVLRGMDPSSFVRNLDISGG